MGVSSPSSSPPRPSTGTLGDMLPTASCDDGDHGPDETLAPGARLGRYIVEDVVGVGGTGVVYRAHDPQLGRPVAVKLLRASRSREPERAQQRLLREAQAMASLTHPNVLPVYDVGTQDGCVFVAMELAPGGTLRTWLREPRPLEAIVKVMLAAGEGLLAAHLAGLVHRDFKPDNVLVARDGSVRVSDFGLVRIDETIVTSGDGPALRSGSAPLTHAGALAGTPGYMAPEQYEAARDVGPAADQFAFAVTLHEAVYGTRPFQGLSIADLRRATFGGELPVPKPGHGVPPWVRALLVRALKVRPEERYPSMRVLLDALAHDPAKKRRFWIGLGAALLVTAGASTAGFLAADRRSKVCNGSDAPLASVWSAAPAEALRASFLATGAPFAPTTFERVAKTLNAYTKDWAASHRDACEATRLRGEQSESMLTLRMGCLATRRAELAAVVRVLSAGERKAVEHAVETVDSLVPLRVCSDVVGLAAPVPPPTTPEAREELPRLAERLAEARALGWAERDADARVVIDELEPRARTLGHGPFLAEVLYVRGRIEWALGEWAKAESTFLETLAIADESKHDAVRADIELSLVNLVGTDISRVEDGARHGRAAEALVRRLGDVVRERELHGRRAFYYLHIGDNEAARREAEAGLALGVDNDSKRSLDAELRSALAGAYSALGDSERAEREDRTALALEEARLGPDHPALLPRLTNLATSLQEAHKLDEALAFIERAERLAHGGFGETSAHHADTLDMQSDVLAALGRLDEAATAAERSIALYDTHHPEMPRVGYALLSAGRIRAKMHRYPEALAYLTRAVRVLDERKMVPASRAQAHGEIAKVQWELGTNRGDALARARSAQQELVAAGDKESSDELEAWIAAHAAR